MNNEEVQEVAAENRRLSLRSALTPLNETDLGQLANTDRNTPGREENRAPSISPEEFLIEHRGRRRKPLTWSPVDYNKTNLLGPSREVSPTKMPRKAEISLKLRRRLIMNSYEESKSVVLGGAIAMKLKAISDLSANNTIMFK